MNWEEAEKVLEEGKCVRLPEWRGYWFKQREKYDSVYGQGSISDIKAMTKDGEVADAWYDDERITSRIDWEIAEGLGFDWAITAMNAGKKVARRSWDNKGYIWKMPATDVPLEWIKEEGLKELAIQNGGKMSCLASIRKKTKSGQILTGWCPDADDIFALDWHLYVELR